MSGSGVSEGISLGSFRTQTVESALWWGNQFLIWLIFELILCLLQLSLIEIFLTMSGGNRCVCFCLCNHNGLQFVYRLFNLLGSVGDSYFFGVPREFGFQNFYKKKCVLSDAELKLMRIVYWNNQVNVPHWAVWRTLR